ncbi:uncharacterized protein Ecym_2420 [Eremothecium cymbalariae DBVPG|uniref:Uncharacterized protein n=1 Tax=Eremothecium cymbalariae (strain CBS 270.75 / DBVPG 7215 / KCTC 17166 / NRRL Y-17582) TaxID=931890 RepID=G8JP94_ERECY|nr:Hypothetical protein Ecym_2420 [Eremothecium cymbalariae DBVPG\
MSINIQKSSDNCIISGYKVTDTSKYIIFAELSISGPVKSSLKLHIVEKEKTLKFEISLNIGLYDEVDYSVLNHFEIIDAPILSKNKIEKKSVLVINTGNGIQIISLEQLFGFRDTESEVQKWYLDQNADRIMSFVSKATSTGFIEIWFCTKLGKILSVRYSLIHENFTSHRQLLGSSNDTLNYMSAGYRENSQWEDKIGPLKHVAVACFDNNIYWLSNGNIEKQSILQYMDNNEEHTLISVEFAIVKQFSTTSIIYFCGQIMNLGCVLYKRSTRGDWNLVHVFERAASRTECSPLINCQVHFDGNSILTIVSGSECGKLYVWKYDYKLEMEIGSNCIEVAREHDIIHNIQLLSDSKIYFLCNRQELNYVDV